MTYQPQCAAPLSNHVFVYGTLKRGQCRESCWPTEPLAVRSAWTYGTLYDLGPYPALLVGNDRILGELWSFEPEDVPGVLLVLDRVEGTNQPGLANEYDRVQVAVTWLECGENLVASTYRFCDERLAARHKRLLASYESHGQRFVVWP